MNHYYNRNPMGFEGCLVSFYYSYYFILSFVHYFIFPSFHSFSFSSYSFSSLLKKKSFPVSYYKTLFLLYTLPLYFTYISNSGAYIYLWKPRLGIKNQYNYKAHCKAAQLLK